MASSKDIQRLLNEHGANLTVDGIIGPLTKAAIRQFQKDNGLTVDGVVGPRTLGILNGEDSSAADGSDASAGSGGSGGSLTVLDGGTVYKVKGVGTVLVYETTPESGQTISAMYLVHKDDLDDTNLTNTTNGGSMSSDDFDEKFPNMVNGGRAYALDDYDYDDWETWFTETILEFTGYNRVALDDPEVMSTLVEALITGMTTEELQAKLSQTDWAKTSNEQNQKWDLADDVDRDAYIADNIGRLSQAYRSAWGIVPGEEDEELARLSKAVSKGEMSYGQAVIEVQNAAGEHAETPEATRNRELNRRGVEIEKMGNDLYDQGMTWGIKLSDRQKSKWATGINDLNTELTEADFEEYMKGMAEVSFGSRELGSSNRGRDMTVEDWSQPYRSSWSELLETSDDLDLVFDQRFMKHMTDGKSVAEFRDVVRESDDWKGTDNARKSVSDTVGQLGNMMGY